MKTFALLAMLAALISGCGTQEPIPEADFYVDRIGVKIDTPAILVSPSFPEGELRAVISEVAKYAGHDLSGLDGWVIVFTNREFRCQPGLKGLVLGCEHDGWIEVFTYPGADDCLAHTSLPHELLHAFIGDACHRDPLWRDWVSVQGNLESLTCYAPLGRWWYEQSC